MSVDHILQHDLVQENTIAAKFISTMEKEMQNIKECFNTKMMLILGSKNGAKTMNCVIHHSKIKNRQLLISDSRDTEDRIKSCYDWKNKCLHHIDRSSNKMKLVHELIKECIYNCFLINEFMQLMNSLNLI